MEDVIWFGAVAAGAICLGAGTLGWIKNPRSRASTLFMLAMVFVFISLAIGTLFGLVEEEGAWTADVLARVFVVAYVVALTFLWELAIVFPVERDVTFRPPNLAGAVMVAALVSAVAAGLFGGVVFDQESGQTLTTLSLHILASASVAMVILASVLILVSRARASEQQRRSGTRYLVGLFILLLGGMVHMATYVADAPSRLVDDLAMMSITIGAAVSGVIFAYSIAMGEMVMLAEPRAEAMASSSKASYKLLHRYVYFVEEDKPDFSFKMFADILKGRCFDCENDDSFPCESLECASCRLPCPCRTCTKYKSRAQGLIVTRQHPNLVRSKFFIQTTPMIWLSSVAGKDNMDPAKISLLTDHLVNFMEKSHNGVVLVDGIEYLITSNDFQRVSRSLDKWTETAMTSSCRLVITVDPRAFSERELALLEKHKEVVRPSEEDGLDAVIG